MPLDSTILVHVTFVPYLIILVQTMLVLHLTILSFLERKSNDLKRNNFQFYKKRDVSRILRLKYKIFATFCSLPTCLGRYTSFTGLTLGGAEGCRD
uniref:Uncharacterized protein n=1 Tax=Glossina palpalis gambiensis TaxID=67801 RepID=A0A1B0BK46_9MUSC